jgi:hypothetical protein
MRSPVSSTPTREESSDTEVADSRPAAATVSESFREEVRKQAPEGVDVFLGEVVFQSRLPLVGLKARLVYEKLANLGDVCYFTPPVEEVDELEGLDRTLNT